MGVFAVVAAATTLVTLGATGMSAGTQEGSIDGMGHSDRIPGRYIVVLEDDEAVRDSVRAAEGAYGAEVDAVYTSALKGFAAHMTLPEAQSLARSPGVVFVQADTSVQATVQRMPTGINRSEADASPTARIDGRDERVRVDVAVLDTGVDLDHPDLNVFRRGTRNCSQGSPGADDQHGHGTHVAGIVGALDNQRGVVGVAPGARIWPVRVLGPNGEGSTAEVICGIDFVTANARSIEVANMSLGGVGQDDGNCGMTNQDAEHLAICRSVSAGVTYVVAAGNEAQDAAGVIPASYDEVITVSALADFDGRPGSVGRPTCGRDVDDTLAPFSNFGPDVDLIAPGVCIRSTGLRGRYATLSGTSQASPHVAGGAALHLAVNPAAPPSVVQAELEDSGSIDWDSTDDLDGVQEPLLDLTGF